MAKRFAPFESALARRAGVAAGGLRRARPGPARRRRTASPRARTPGQFADIEQLIDVAHVDYLQPSVIKIGGVTEMRQGSSRSAPRAAFALAPHSPYFGPGLIATVHICASMPAQPPVERFYCDLEASPLGDLINVDRRVHARADMARVSGSRLTMPSSPNTVLAEPNRATTIALGSGRRRRVDRRSSCGNRKRPSARQACARWRGDCVSRHSLCQAAGRRAALEGAAAA